jgi:hypothetical protein
MRAVVALAVGLFNIAAAVNGPQVLVVAVSADKVSLREAPAAVSLASRSSRFSHHSIGGFHHLFDAYGRRRRSRR